MSVAETIWNMVRDRLRETHTTVTMSAWFDDCSAVDMTSSTLILHTPNAYKGDVIIERYGDVIKSIINELMSAEYSLRVLSDESIQDYKKETSAASEDSEKFTFERFVVGNSNKFAHGASKAVAGGAKDYNPLFIYGNSGLGKTHLLRAIRHAIRQNHPEYSIIYVKSEDFTNELISALQVGTSMQKFRQKYRFANVFLMDDVQFIAGKERTEEEFFHTFNALIESGGQLVLTSDRPPNEIARIEDRLRSRFESGLIADITPPDYEMRMAIIRNKAIELGFSLPDDISSYLAETLTANIRQLEGAVKKLHAICGINGIEHLSLPEVIRRTKDIIRENERAITVELIINETALFFDLTPDELTGRRRTRGTAHARQISMYLIRTLTPLSLNDIGDILGGRDHTTIMSGIRNIEEEMKINTSLAQTVKDITANIRSKAESYP